MYRSISAVALIALFGAGDVQAAHSGKHDVQFTVTLENVSTETTLRSASGETAPAPNSPGLWLVHAGQMPLFRVKQKTAGTGLEWLAERGDPSKLWESVQRNKALRSGGVFDTPVGETMAGPLLPGKRFEFTINAHRGDRLTLATMFGQSNDLFYAPSPEGIALFDDQGRPLGGDMTNQLVLWDAGTEVNEEPGFGPNQAPRQATPEAGRPESMPVQPVADSFRYPAVREVLKLTITPMESSAQK